MYSVNESNLQFERFYEVVFVEVTTNNCSSWFVYKSASDFCDHFVLILMWVNENSLEDVKPLCNDVLSYGRYWFQLHFWYETRLWTRRNTLVVTVRLWICWLVHLDRYCHTASCDIILWRLKFTCHVGFDSLNSHFLTLTFYSDRVSAFVHSDNEETINDLRINFDTKLSLILLNHFQT